MTGGVQGDPASCSQLGGTLRSQAARLLKQRSRVHESLAALSRAAPAPGLADRVGRDVRLLESTADRLDTAGSALQRYAQELAEVIEATRRLEASARQSGLALEGLRVVEPWGVSSSAQAAQRRAALPDLQARADRLATQLGRARAQLARTLTESSGVLRRASAAAREALGR